MNSLPSKFQILCSPIYFFFFFLKIAHVNIRVYLFFATILI